MGRETSTERDISRLLNAYSEPVTVVDYFTSVIYFFLEVRSCPAFLDKETNTKLRFSGFRIQTQVMDLFTVSWRRSSVKEMGKLWAVGCCCLLNIARIKRPPNTGWKDFLALFS